MAPRRPRRGGYRGRRRTGTQAVAPTSVICDSAAVVLAGGTIAAPTTTNVNYGTLPLTAGIVVPVRVSSVRIEALATTVAPGILTTNLNDSTGTTRIDSREIMVGNSTRTRFTLRMPKSTDFGDWTAANNMIQFVNAGGGITLTYVVVVAARTL